ncbi:TnsA endonuclease C-terminal domain-containing protein [Reinekea sp. G2M2-21]|uniref:TnsA endonuclease C-terminal domain-containing protein n=1 Tax=Reinekea sp. G2M2-21 TaxID=2788942 RepID=UPI0018AAFF24|nr:TnsA endonuclease C-terminal domain-containing protein [Reinekea sp. G2M2-21]
MSRKQYWNSEAKNQSWIKEGRGRGAGAEYKPWLTIRDVPSKGRSHRVFGHLTQRIHHLLSDLELATYFLLQWRRSTSDIREQFPLDRDTTREICRRLGIAHPNERGIDQYMSSDFVVDSNEKNNSKFVIQVKPKGLFNDSRTVEKLQVEREYWREKRIPFYLVTEAQIPRTVFENINVLYNYMEDDVDYDELHMSFNLFQDQISRSGSIRVIDICKSIDASYQLDLGESLAQLKLLLARRYFHFDIFKPFTELRCSDLVAEDFESLRGGWRVSS